MKKPLCIHTGVFLRFTEASKTAVWLVPAESDAHEKGSAAREKHFLYALAQTSVRRRCPVLSRAVRSPRAEPLCAWRYLPRGQFERPTILPSLNAGQQAYT